MNKMFVIICCVLISQLVIAKEKVVERKPNQTVNFGKKVESDILTGPANFIYYGTAAGEPDIAQINFSDASAMLVFNRLKLPVQQRNDTCPNKKGAPTVVEFKVGKGIICDKWPASCVGSKDTYICQSRLTLSTGLIEPSEPGSGF